MSLAIKTSKLTAEVLQKAMKALLAKGKGQLTKAPHGKITMRQLMKPGEKVSNIEITDQNIKAFDPIARKTGLITTSRRLRTASRRPTLCLLGARILTL